MNRLESFNNNTFDQNDDQLNWKSFFTNSDLNISNFPSKVYEFNRLIMHTDNLFLIAGYGAFNEGYTILIPKKLISVLSVCCLD